MTNYAEKLATLDTKAGRVHTIDDWQRVRRKAEHSPEAVMDDDLTIIGYFDGPEHVARAVERRQLAIHPAFSPPDTRATTATKSTPARSAPAANVALLPTVEDADDLSSDEGLDAWVTKNELAAVPVIIWRGFVKAARDKRLALEARVAELEARPELKFAGSYRQGESYAAGCFVSRSGGLWLAERSTSGIPGTADGGWRLIVKEGRAQ